MEEAGKRTRPRIVIWLEWAAVVLLIGGVAAYIFWKPLNPMSNPKAAEALAIVQTHAAKSAPTIRQAIDGVMLANRKPGRTPSMGDWTVRPNDRTIDRQGYLVKVEIRLPADQPDRWFEWQYLWLVRLPTREIVPLSRPAAELMP